jgi:hypothetical protein
MSNTSAPGRRGHRYGRIFHAEELTLPWRDPEMHKYSRADLIGSWFGQLLSSFSESLIHTA